MKFKYDNITISGGVAVGKNALVENLKSYLMPYDWKFFSGGEFMRDYAIKNNLFPKDATHHHMATIYSDDFDKQVDYGMKERLEKEKHLVLEAWLSGFFGRSLDNTLRVLLICSHNPVRVDRVANRDKLTVEQAKKFIKERENENFKKWQRMYGDYDFFNPKYYNVVIDTYSSGQLETVGIVLDKLGYDSSKINIEKK